MPNKLKDLGFLVEVYQKCEVGCAPPYDDESDTHVSKIGNFFMIDKNEENVRMRITKLLPDSNKYSIKVRPAEQEINGIYGFERIDHPSF